MARPCNPIVGDGPPLTSPATCANCGRQGNPTYQTMAQRGHSSTTALSQAAAGKTLPTREMVRAFCTGLGQPAGSLTHLAADGRWQSAHEAVARPAVRPVTPVRPPARTVDDPREATTLDELAAALDRLRLRAGLSERAVAARSAAAATTPGVTAEFDGVRALRRYDVDSVLSGRRRLTPQFVALFVAACGIDRATTALWVDYSQRLYLEEQRAKMALQVLTVTLPTGISPSWFPPYHDFGNPARVSFEMRVPDAFTILPGSQPDATAEPEPAPEPARDWSGGAHRRPPRTLRQWIGRLRGRDTGA